MALLCRVLLAVGALGIMASAHAQEIRQDGVLKGPGGRIAAALAFAPGDRIVVAYVTGGSEDEKGQKINWSEVRLLDVGSGRYRVLARASTPATLPGIGANHTLRGFSADGKKVVVTTFDPGGTTKELLLDVAETKLPSVENKMMRARAELTVHGAGVGPAGETPPNYQLWLEVENLTGAMVTLTKPTITSSTGDFRVSRWYEEGGKGQAWDGVLKGREKKAIYVIGEAGDKVKAGKEIVAKISLDALTLEVKAIAKEGLLFRCPCGCDRSEKMVAELRQQEDSAALTAIQKALASIAEREQQRYVTAQMLTHRLRLLRLAEEIQSRD